MESVPATLRNRALLVILTVTKTSIVLADSNVSREQMGNLFLEYSVSTRSPKIMMSATILIITGPFRQSKKEQVAAPLRNRALLVKLTVTKTSIVLADSNVSRDQMGNLYLEYSVSTRSKRMMMSATILIIRCGTTQVLTAPLLLTSVKKI